MAAEDIEARRGSWNQTNFEYAHAVFDISCGPISRVLMEAAAIEGNRGSWTQSKTEHAQEIFERF